MCVCVCVCVSVQERNWFLVSSQKSRSYQAEEREGWGGDGGGKGESSCMDINVQSVVAKWMCNRHMLGFAVSEVSLQLNSVQTTKVLRMRL